MAMTIEQIDEELNRLNSGDWNEFVRNCADVAGLRKDPEFFGWRTRDGMKIDWLALDAALRGPHPAQWTIYQIQRGEFPPHD